MSLPNPIQYHIYGGGQHLPAPTFYSYILAGQGLIKWAVTPHFEARAIVCRKQLPGLPILPAGVILTVPKIPYPWLRTVHQHACRASFGGPGGILRVIEAMYHFHYLADEGWRVATPKQKGTPGQVRYNGGDAPSIVLDLHSHHTMNAFFSQTDTGDEQGCRFYAVIGNIYARRPQIALRLGIYGDFLPLPATTIFDHLGPFEDIYAREDIHENSKAS